MEKGPNPERGSRGDSLGVETRRKGLSEGDSVAQRLELREPIGCTGEV